jgi:transposase-like protein
MFPIPYRRHRFPPTVIQHAVWLYLRFTLSYRDVEELLAQRGLDLSYESVRSWVLKFGPMSRSAYGARPPLSDASAKVGSSGNSGRSAWAVATGIHAPKKTSAAALAIG